MRRAYNLLIVKLSVVMVHYFTPDLAKRACHALLHDASASDLELEIVLVNNGIRAEDQKTLASLPARLLEPGRNLGYAGGANLGITETEADLIVVMNPDVEVIAGCLRALADALMSGASVAGPRFYWDRDKRLQLPPTEAVGHLPEILRILAQRGKRWARIARRRWRRHARRQWMAQATLPSYDLSGALLAFRRSTWEQIGPFDEGFRLYFEETNWLQRLRRAGLPASFVPTAEAVHLYAQSTVREGEAQSWFLESNRRFRLQLYGRAFTNLLEALASRPVPLPPEASTCTQPINLSDVTSRHATWLEVSPSPLGYPAAGWPLGPRTALPRTLPAEVLGRLAPGTYTMTYVDDHGREVGSKRFQSSEARRASHEG